MFLHPDTDAEGARRVASLLLDGVRALALSHSDPEAGSVVTIRLGVAAAVPGDGPRSGGTRHPADRSLYRATAAGRNRVEVDANSRRLLLSAEGDE